MIAARCMEVDALQYQPPRSFRVTGTRPMSSKRARSPGSPSPSERATKKFIKTDVDPVYLKADSYLDATAASSGWNGKAFYPDPINQRVGDDSWVTRTSGLTIDSPIIPGSLTPPLPVGTPPDLTLSILDDQDIHMSSPEQSHRIVPSTSASSSTSLRDPFQLTDRDRHLLNSPPQLALSLSTDTISSSSSSSMHFDTTPPLSDGDAGIGPHIHVYPATPSTPSDNMRNDFLGTSISGVNCISPNASRRRQMLTMGPRADCEKCRMRVPGHWMHFD